MTDRQVNPLIAALQAITGAAGLLVHTDDVAPFVRDWRGRFAGQALCVVQPATVEEASAAMAACAQHGVAVVPQGGNTGLCGGATPDAAGTAVVMSMRRLKRVRSVDLDNGSLVCEAGCVLADIQRLAEDHDRLFPLSLAAEGSAQIGGVLATNAGGTAVLRYGNARDLVLGLEVLLPDGRLWNGLRSLRKDNTGYDLKHLFIGSEGTLGLITAAVLKLMPRPRSVATALVALESPVAAVRLLRDVQNGFGERVSAFELFSGDCMDMVVGHVPAARSPFDTAHAWYALLEVSDTWPDAPLAERLEEQLATSFDGGGMLDAVVASSVAQQKALWGLRENISEAQKQAGYSLKYDISVPRGELAGFLADTSAELLRRWPDLRIAPFGHVGDGNLHFNIAPSGDSAEKAISEVVYEAVQARHGSFSAEHGIGQLKVGELTRFKAGVEYSLFRTLKNAIDPSGRMNPGKVLA